MENRLAELASIVEWVDDLALEPKWRLAAWHTTLVDGKAVVGGARNLDTRRTRIAGCMVRHVRQEVLAQLPARTDTRIPVEMTSEQAATTQRIIANGVAQLRVEEQWPDLARIERADGSDAARPRHAEAPGLRELIGQLALAPGAQGRGLQPVAADAAAGGPGHARGPGRRARPRRLLLRRRDLVTGSVPGALAHADRSSSWSQS